MRRIQCHQVRLATVTRVDYTSRLNIASDSLAFGWLMWPTLIIVDDISWCLWIHIFKIFSTILMMSSLMFWLSPRSFLSLSLSLILIVIFKRDEREKRKRSWRHIKTFMITLLVSKKKKSWRDKSNDTKKKNHQWWQSGHTSHLKGTDPSATFR